MGERHARFGFAGDRGIASGDPRQDLRKARPERISFTFRDDATGAVALDLATRRHWFAGTVSAVFFAIFLAVAVGSGQRITLHEAHDVFGFMMMLFDVFWVIGWSAGVLILGGLAFSFLLYRESARIEGGRLVHVPRVGPLRIVCEYDLAKIGNLRVEPAKKGHAARVRFDYANGTARIGDAMPPDAAQAVIDAIRRAMPMAASSRVTADPPRADAGSDAGFLEPKRAVRPSDERAGEPRAALSSPATIALIAANLLPLVGVVARAHAFSRRERDR